MIAGIGRPSLEERGVVFLGTLEASLSTLVDPLEFPESRHGCGAHAVHLCPVEVIALSSVSSLRTQLFDLAWGAHVGLNECWASRLARANAASRCAARFDGHARGWGERRGSLSENASRSNERNPITLDAEEAAVNVASQIGQ